MGLCLDCITESTASRLREVVFTSSPCRTCETALVSNLVLPSATQRQTGVESYQDIREIFI